MRYSQGEGVNTSLSRLVGCTHVHCVLCYNTWCSFPVCVLVPSVARSCATRDDNNKDNVRKPNIPAGIKCPPPSKTISPITWFGAISTKRIRTPTGTSKRKLSTRSFENRPFRHYWHPLGCEVIEPGKSSSGVCQDSDTNGSGDHHPIKIHSQCCRNSAVKFKGTTVLIVCVLFV